MKKRHHVLSTITGALITMATLCFSSIAAEVTNYDINGDGSISMADLVSLNLFIAEMDSPETIVVADLDEDGLITITDSFLLLKYIAEQEESETTSSTTTTTTETTTTTTAPTTTEETVTTTGEPEYFSLIESVLVSMKEDEEIPSLTDDTYTEGKGVFFFEYNDQIYAYTRLTSNPNAPSYFDVQPYYIDALHIWKYEGTTNISFDVPNTDGLTFEWNGESYSYNLEDTVNEGDITTLALYLFEESWDHREIRSYDYNLDGVLTVEDLETTILLCGNNISQLKSTSVDWIEQMENFLMDALTPPAISDNFVVHFNSDFQEYSLVNPPYYFDECYFYNGFYQVLPDSYYDQLYEEFGPPVTDGGDYILYNMVDSWTTWSEKTDIAWAWVTPIDNNGEYLSERYDDPNYAY